MAWATKYRIYVPDKDENRQATIDIQKDGYAGSVTDLAGNNECRISTPGGDKLLNRISGKQLKFGFHATAAETSSYDEFLTEDPGAMKVIYKPDGTNIEFVGFIQPGNANRIMAPMVQYRMIATDGLANLKDIDYLDSSGDVYSDTTSKLTIIKRCLQLIGIDECDIFTQVNTYEVSEMTSSEDPINEVDYDNRRFYSNQDGEERPMKAHEVLEEILIPLHARIFQEEGYWKIVNDQEPNSYRVIYDYATLAVDTARAENNRIVDISNKTNYPEYSFTTLGKIQPIKKLRIKFLNKNLGGIEISNGDFQLGTTAGHNNDNWDQFTIDSEGSNYFLKTTDNTGGLTIRHFYSDSFNISTFETGDKIKIRFKVRLNDIIFPGSPPPGQGFPSIYAGVQKDGGTISELSKHYIQEAGTEWQEFIDYYTIPGTGNYVIHFYVKPNETVTYMIYEWDDLFYTQQRETDIVTFDKIYIFTNSAAAYREEELEILFGDSLQNTDAGALKVAGTNTDLWSRYSKGESVGLIELLGQQILNNYQSIKDFRNIRIDDPNNNIIYGTVIQIGSKKFAFHGSYEKDYRMNVVKGRIIELLTSDASITTAVQPLTSIDGESTGSSKEIPISVPSYWLQSTYGIYTANNVGIGMAPTGSYDLEVADNVWIGGNLSVVGTGHDSFSDYVANEHVDHSSVSINAGTGLSGGGDITTTRTINLSAGLNDLTDVTFSALAAQDTMYYNGSVWTNYPWASLKNTLNWWQENSGDVYYYAGGVGVGDGAGIVIGTFDVRIPSGPTSNLAWFGENSGTYGIQVKNNSATGFIPTIWMFPELSTDYSYFDTWIEDADDTGAVPTVQFSTRKASGAIATRPLFQWLNNTTAAFTIDSNYDIIINQVPDAGDSADELLLRDATTGVITKLGIGTNLTVSGGNLNASGSGTVDVSGTPVANQLAIWVDADTIKGDANLTWSGTILNITGELQTDTLQLDSVPSDVSDLGTEGHLLVRDSTTGDLKKVTSSSSYSDDYFLDADGNWSVPGPLMGSYIEQNAATWSVGFGGAKSSVKPVKTNNTTATWTVSGIGIEALFEIYYSHASPKTLTITITGQLLIDVNNPVAFSAATASLVITIPGGADMMHELLINKTGHTYSSKDIYMVSFY